MKSEKEKFISLILNNEIDKIKDFLIIDPTIIVSEYEDGIIPPFIASEKGYFELVKFMMEYTRVSMNVFDNHHRSILHYAAKGNNVELFTYLVERISMNPLEVDLDLETPLDYAKKYNSQNIIDYYTNILNITTTYKNPVVSGAFPDPSVIRVDDDYYMVASSFVYFPCIPILHSIDLINWKIIGHAITDNSYIDLTKMDNGRGFWAPDISYNDGKFYITATYRLNDDENPVRLQMVVHSTNPEGPYSKPTFIDEDGIDPSIFTDDDGRRYMLLNRGARIFEITKDGDKKLSEPTMLWYGNNKRAPEAPHLLKKDGYYYIFVSEGGTGRDHQISVARSKELMGVYENCPYNPILTQNDESHPIQRSGHGKFVETQTGEWYITYLCGRMIDQKWSMLGRETALDKITWTLDGWPIVNNLKGPSGCSKIPNIPSNIKPKTFSYKGRFGLNCDWQFVRNPEPEFIKVNNETITYIAGNKDLYEMNARNILVQRQNKFIFDFNADIIINKDNFLNNAEAGLTCYYDTTSYIKYFLTKENNKFYITLIEKIGLDELKHDKLEINFNERINLKVKTNYLKREFYFTNDKKEELAFSLNNVYYLSDEGIPFGKRFTGAMFGLYALNKEYNNDFVVDFIFNK